MIVGLSCMPTLPPLTRGTLFILSLLIPDLLDPAGVGVVACLRVAVTDLLGGCNTHIDRRNEDGWWTNMLGGTCMHAREKIEG